MNVGLLGYYGYGNFGDETILENLRLALSPHRTTPIPLGLPDSKDTVSRLNSFDAIILGGGQLYQKEPPSPFGSFDRWGGRLTTPIGVLGLGVSSLPSCYRAATLALVDSSIFFYVRDQQSKDLIGDKRVKVTADLSFFKPMEMRERVPHDHRLVCGVNLRPSQGLVQRWIEEINALPCAKTGFTFADNELLGDHRTLLEIDASCSARFALDQYKGIDLLIGTAFHSIVFAIQNGTPVIAINYDPKVERLMCDAGLDSYLLEWSDFRKLPVTFERVLHERKAVRQTMKRYTAQAVDQVRQSIDTVQMSLGKLEETKISVSVREPEPLVSILFYGRDHDHADLDWTLSKCLQQTHRNLELLVFREQGVPKSLSGRRRIGLLPFQNVRECLANGLAGINGEFVVWLQTGSWLAPDAISLLSARLNEESSRDLAHADFFLTRSGVIEQKIRLDSACAPGKARFLGPCFLLRRDRLRSVTVDESLRIRRFRRRHAYYCKHSLLYKPFSSGEKRLFEGLLACGRGEFTRANRMLSQAVQELASDHQWIEVNNVAETLARIARKAMPSDPHSQVEAILSGLPQETSKRLGVVRRKTFAELSMTRFFELQRAGRRAHAYQCAFSGIQYDPAWLCNNGFWKCLMRSLVIGRLTPIKSSS